MSCLEKTRRTHREAKAPEEANVAARLRDCKDKHPPVSENARGFPGKTDGNLRELSGGKCSQISGAPRKH